MTELLPEEPIMAKKAKVSKAQSVRDYLTGHPDATTAEVVKSLEQNGVHVTGQYVSVLRSKKVGKRAKPVTTLKDTLKQERASLMKRLEAIDTLLG